MKISLITTACLTLVTLCIVNTHMHGNPYMIGKYPVILEPSPHISLCNVTYKAPVSGIIMNGAHTSYGNVLFGIHDGTSIASKALNSNEFGRERSVYITNELIDKFQCQEGIANMPNPAAVWTHQMLADSYNPVAYILENSQNLASEPYSMAVAPQQYMFDKTFWIVPNIRHVRPKYMILKDDDPAPKFLMIPVSNDNNLAQKSLDAGIAGSTKDWCKTCSDNQNTFRVNDCRGCRRNLTSWNVTHDGSQGNTYNNETWKLLNTYFNYIFLDTVINNSDTTYNVATTDAPLTAIVNYLDNVDSNAKKSVLYDWLGDPTVQKLPITPTQSYKLKIYSSGYSPDNFNNDNWMTFFAKGTKQHLVSPAALSTQKEADDPNWHNQTLILFPSDKIGYKDVSVILIGRDADGIWTAYTYYTYNKKNTFKVSTKDTDTSPVVAQYKDYPVDIKQLDETANLGFGKNGRFLISIAPAPLKLAPTRQQKMIDKKDPVTGQIMKDANNNPIQEPATDKNGTIIYEDIPNNIPIPYVDRFDALPGIYLPDQGQPNKDKQDFEINVSSTTTAPSVQMSGSSGFRGFGMSTIGMDTGFGQSTSGFSQIGSTSTSKAGQPGAKTGKTKKLAKKLVINKQ